MMRSAAKRIPSHHRAILILTVLLGAHAATRARAQQQEYDWQNQQQEQPATDAECLISSIRADPELSVLSRALDQTGLASTLGSSSVVKVYAPRDAAFAALAESPSQEVLAMDLDLIIKHHIRSSDDDVTVDAAGASAKRQGACNGALIKIDEVLLPSLTNPQGVDEEVDDDFQWSVPSPSSPSNAINTTTTAPPPPKEASSSDCQGTTPSLANAAGAVCCDKQPMDYGCDDQAAWGKCDEAWLVEGGFCMRACGRCFDGGEIDGSPAPPAFAWDPAMGRADERADAPTPNGSGGGGGGRVRGGDPMAAYATAGILFQQWRGLPGARISDMLRSPELLEEPDVAEVLSGEDGFGVPPANTRPSDTAARVSGFFCPPMSGEYRFGATSDDASRVYVSAGPTNEKTALIKIDRYRAPGDWKPQEGTIRLEKVRACVRACGSVRHCTLPHPSKHTGPACCSIRFDLIAQTQYYSVMRHTHTHTL